MGGGGPDRQGTVPGSRQTDGAMQQEVRDRQQEVRDKHNEQVTDKQIAGGYPKMAK